MSARLATPLSIGVLGLIPSTLTRGLNSRGRTESYSVLSHTGSSPYSDLSASIGSTFAARLAGIQAATTTASASTNTICRKVKGSLGSTL